KRKRFLTNVVARLWTPAAVACFRHNGPAWLLAIGIDTAEDYRAAACLCIDAVMTDSPAELQAIRAATVLPLRCHGTVQ
ncbi:glycerophosphodiester phosphodiesterase, partial [Cupriavidus necator]